MSASFVFLNKHLNCFQVKSTKKLNGVSFLFVQVTGIPQYLNPREPPPVGLAPPMCLRHYQRSPQEKYLLVQCHIPYRNRLKEHIHQRRACVARHLALLQES